MEIIDIHSFLGEGRFVKRNLDQLLNDMDAAILEFSVVQAPDQYAAVYNREGNDLIARAVHAHPKRIGGWSVINPWYEAEGRDELRRSVESGLLGLTLNTSLAGCFLTDPMVFELIEVAAELAIPVRCHTATPPHALPLGVMAIANEFPDTTFIPGSCGWTDGWFDVPNTLREADNVLIDTSLCNLKLLENVIAEFGTEKLLFASGAPVEDVEIETGKIRMLNLSEEETENVFNSNARRVLKKQSGN